MRSKREKKHRLHDVNYPQEIGKLVELLLEVGCVTRLGRESETSSASYGCGYFHPLKIRFPSIGSHCRILGTELFRNFPTHAQSTRRNAFIYAVHAGMATSCSQGLKIIA